MKQDIPHNAVQAMPPMAAIVAFLTDTTPERWLTYLGLLVLSLQGIYWIVKLWKERK
jgi:hypothetical protein